MLTKVIFLVVGTLLCGVCASNGSQPVLMQTAGFMMDPITVRDAEEAFQDAWKEELPGLRDTSLLAGRSRWQVVNTHPGTNTPVTVPASLTASADEPVSDFEKDVTELVLGLSKQGVAAAATPMGSSVKKLQDVVEKDMMPKVKAAHDANQKELIKLAAAIKACGVTQAAAADKAQKYNDLYKATSPLHKTCRTTEAALYMQNIQAWTKLKELKKIKIALCHAFSVTAKKVGEQNNNKGIVSKSGNENVETYVRRITATICGKPGGKGKGGNGKGGFLDLFLVDKEKCEIATVNFNKQEARCKLLDKQWHDTRKKCDALQDVMDKNACKYAVAIKDSCESYAECYKDKKEAYDQAEKVVRQEEIDRKAEWKGLMRMKCLITAFGDGKVEDAEIKKCKNQTHSTGYFNITYPQIPPMAQCQVPDLYPVSAAYIAKEFTPLPAMAKGRLGANECSGFQEISTEPKPGSPASCKCTRVTLNGPYSAGAMVKCMNCIATRRSQDANSCPFGTKLFSPSSRADWTTFLKSARPLRAPNWIIDVTRPQNGCGGCTRFPMNSGVKEQQTWRTNDGTPWWLRSTRYNEPNGDYHANCYLDLWHNPPNADSVTWNDGSCSYHSKSYYCEAAKMSLTPKSGSPSGCVCSKVQIASGHQYSQQLVKCVNCLRVRRSNDKNSCPFGTKIFAPSSRKDWKAFIASAGPLRAPHWIIDITRPQNGCGGCTRHPMNSGSSPQATWRTADKAPWWLRSTRYNEPNGDYHANCYLDLWQTPANENVVTWNDGNCNYHSISYYCQTPYRPSKTFGTTGPPWSGVVSTIPKAGSPTSCKCEQLTLKGTYSARALVKCSACLEVKKKTDTNSCPDGTKLWAPASREDWKTFFASGGKPLRAPHWIIDITRPANGCGGCTRNAMNSANGAQSTWKTSDGAPWWLRSRTYNEPNGDYHANCYLDLWQTPANEDSITWNDGSCNYKSKSYYCQPKNQ